MANNNQSQIAPTILILFGISGHLSKNKVLPALYHLYKDKLLPLQIQIIGLSRQQITIHKIFENVKLCSHIDEQDLANNITEFKNSIEIIQFDPNNIDDYLKLKQHVIDFKNQFNFKNVNLLFYLSIPPQVFLSVIKNLGESNLNKLDSTIKSKILVEKPFGYDLKSAQNLIFKTNEYFNEDQIFRIDHYLAKETAQNILTFRRFNPLFQTAWNNQHIKNIDIIASEKIDIEGRIEFYEEVGALRDLIQSHLFQLLALTTMTLPEDMSDTKAIHLARHAILSEIKPFNTTKSIKENVIRGQYSSYKQEVNNPHSMVETFASIRLTINNSLWKGVPIRLITGKALKEKKTEIRINFGAVNESAQNQLTFRIQPNEGIDIKLSVKQPGFDQRIQPAIMDFSYQTTFEDHHHPDSYERVMIDSFKGDNTLFATSDEVLDSWYILQPILDYWQKNKDLVIYKKGSLEEDILK